MKNYWRFLAILGVASTGSFYFGHTYSSDDLEPVAAEMVQLQPSDATSTPSVRVGVVQYLVNLRAGPDTDHRVLSKVDAGTIVTIVGKKDGWYQVVVNSREGYISQSLITEGCP